MVDPNSLDARVPQVGPLVEIFLSHPGVQRGTVELGPGEWKSEAAGGGGRRCHLSPVAVVEFCSRAVEGHSDAHGNLSQKSFKLFVKTLIELLSRERIIKTH